MKTGVWYAGLFARKISDGLSDIVCSAAGIVTLILGVKMAFESQNAIYLALALIAGGFWLARRLKKKEKANDDL